MNYRKEKLIDKIVWLLTVVLLFSFTALTMYTWGRYIFFIVCGMVFLFYLIINQGKIPKKLFSFHKRMLFFIAYIACSSIWALSFQDSLAKMQTMFSLTFCLYPIYLYYDSLDSIDALLNAIKWAGVITSLYTISFYGLNNLMQASQVSSLRIQNDFANVNTLGMTAAMVIVIQVWQITYQKCAKLEFFTLFPAVLVVGSSQSRKAIIYVILGIILLVLFKNLDTKKRLKGILKTTFAILLLIIVVINLSRLEMFSGVLHRFEIMRQNQSSGEQDIRQALTLLGIEWWKKSPLLGFGIGCPHIIANQFLNFNAYLHNNYVELLCGGGLIGFFLFYSMHFSCLHSLWKNRKKENAYFSIAMTIIVLMLVTDYAMVSYFSKLQIFYLMTIFIVADKLK